MGTYVYSLRKKHVEADLQGIWPIDVIAMEYAYKESFGYRAETRSYKMMEGRYSSLAMKAVDFHRERFTEEFGDKDFKFFIALGGIEDGTPVMQLDSVFLPCIVYDHYFDVMDGNRKIVGNLYKIKRGKWVVSSTCPGHNWSCGRCLRCGLENDHDSLWANVSAMYEMR